MKLRPYQLDVVSRVHQAWDDGKRCPVMVMGTGTGKCLAPGTPVRMFDGSVLPVEEIVVGDQVMGPDSLPRLVTSTTRGCEMMYRVTPTKGDSYTVNESHILSFRISGKDAVTGPDGRVYTKGDVANIEVRDYLRASKTFKHVAKGWRVAVNYADAPLPADLPPYILGVWLGDGTTAAPAISSVDPEVVSAWYEYAATVNATVRREENGTCPSYYIVSDPDGRGSRQRQNRLIDQLRAAGVWSDKHIPRAYLVNSRANRLQLLAGIIDTDGYLSCNTYDLVFKQPRLARGVAELARSLGLAANVKPCRKTCTTTGATGEYFRICISGDLSVIPCRVPRRIAPARRQVKNVLRVGIAVEPVGVGKYYGFTLAGPDRLFLLGDFTVTHNTATLSHIVAHEQRPSLVMAHRQELVGQLSLTLGKYGVRHRIIAPDTTRRQIEALHMRHLGRRWIDPHAPVAAAGVDTLIRRDSSDAFLRSIDLIVPDECFPAGTLIDGRPIETLRVGDVVTAFDEHTGRFHQRKVMRLFKNPAPKHMVRVCVSHHVLECTSGHPFYTRRGWVEAARLKKDDEVLIYELHAMRNASTGDDREPALPISENGANLLHAEVRLRASGCRAQESASGEASEARNDGHVQGMRAAICGDRVPGDLLAQGGVDLLQPGMLVQVSGAAQFGDYGSNESEIRFGQDAGTEPDASGRSAPESVGFLASDQPPTEAARGQWAPADASGTETAGVVGALRFPATNDRSDGPSHFLSSALQNRLRECDAEDCGGSRRAEPWGQITASAGCEERSVSRWHRLDSVSLYESGDPGQPGDGFVYNIEVDEFHTYVANGVVVHNCHHVLRDNKWGRAIQMMPERARILGPTATPLRADGKGLGIHADGFADELILGPSMRDSIVSGMLTPYRIFCPPTGNLDLSQVATSAGGDFSPKPLAEAVHKSAIVGDVVGSYLRIAPGKRGITFAVDLEHAREICAEYKTKGVPAAVLSADSDTGYRAQVMRDFEAGTLLQLVNVDILGEGVDVPACEVVSFARPTQSFGLYVQQFGRSLRLMIAPELLGMWGDMTDGERAAHIAASVKPTAFIIDHVGNVLRHGLPDAPRRWSLDRREKRGASKGPSDAIPLRVCLAQLPDGTLCTTPYERVLSCCPACGHAPEPTGRSRPEEVDGDLYELDERALAALRGEADRIMAPPLIPQHLDHVAAMALRKRHTERQQAQGRLGEALAWWGGWQEAQGRDMREAYRRFYFAFGVDVATARTLNRTDAEALAAQVERVLLDAGVAMRYI